MLNGMACSQMVFKAAEISLHYFGVTLERENQRDIDIDANGCRSTNGRNARFCGRNFDHEVWTTNSRPELFRLSQGRFCVLRDVRAHFNAYISIAAIGLFI